MRKNALKAKEIIDAYLSGKKVLRKIKGTSDPFQQTSDDIQFDFISYEYTILEEPTYRPFKPEEVPLWKEIKHKDKNYQSRYLISGVNDNSVLFARSASCSFYNLLQDFVFSDGSPCGVTVSKHNP